VRDDEESAGGLAVEPFEEGDCLASPGGHDDQKSFVGFIVVVEGGEAVGLVGAEFKHSLAPAARKDGRRARTFQPPDRR